MRATAAGLRAQQIWRPLPGAVEKRWQERFGREALADLRASLRVVAARLDGGLPDCLPILGYGLRTPGPEHRLPPEDVSGLGLPALLSRVLLAFAAADGGQRPTGSAADGGQRPTGSAADGVSRWS